MTNTHMMINNECWFNTIYNMVQLYFDWLWFVKKTGFLLLWKSWYPWYHRGTAGWTRSSIAYQKLILIFILHEYIFVGHYDESVDRSGLPRSIRWYNTWPIYRGYGLYYGWKTLEMWLMVAESKVEWNFEWTFVENLICFDDLQVLSSLHINW